MNQRDLDALAIEVRRLWGKVSLDVEQTGTLHRYARDLTTAEAKSVLDKMLEDGTEYFTIAKFGFYSMALVRERATVNAMTTKSKLATEGCPHCQGCGQLIAYRRADRFCCGVAFRCTFCGAASAIGLAPQIYPWMSEYGSDFELGVKRTERMQQAGKRITSDAAVNAAMAMISGGENDGSSVGTRGTQRQVQPLAAVPACAFT